MINLLVLVYTISAILIGLFVGLRVGFDRNAMLSTISTGDAISLYYNLVSPFMLLYFLDKIKHRRYFTIFLLSIVAGGVIFQSRTWILLVLMVVFVRWTDVKIWYGNYFRIKYFPLYVLLILIFMYYVLDQQTKRNGPNDIYRLFTTVAVYPFIPNILGMYHLSSSIERVGTGSATVDWALKYLSGYPAIDTIRFKLSSYNVYLPSLDMYLNDWQGELCYKLMSCGSLFYACISYFSYYAAVALLKPFKPRLHSINFLIIYEFYFVTSLTMGMLLYKWYILVFVLLLKIMRRREVRVEE